MPKLPTNSSESFTMLHPRSKWGITQPRRSNPLSRWLTNYILIVTTIGVYNLLSRWFINSSTSTTMTHISLHRWFIIYTTITIVIQSSIEPPTDHSCIYTHSSGLKHIFTWNNTQSLIIHILKIALALVGHLCHGSINSNTPLQAIMCSL